MASAPKSGLKTIDGVKRCWWGAQQPDYQAYHDEEWGFPVSDDTRLFEKLSLEGFQSGLSWLTILRKREGFRKAFADFDFVKIARWRNSRVGKLLEDTSIVRHRGKIEAVLNNAKATCDIAEEFGSFAAYVWRYEPDPSTRPKRVTKTVLTNMTTSPESTALAKDLKKRGFRFFGPTTAYAFMQAMGLVNDHIAGCITRDEVETARRKFKVPR